MKDKFILDACCGGRCFWFNKDHPNTLYIDNRVRKKGHDTHRINHEIRPDEVVDFRNMPYADFTFKLVVFDPPHISKAGETGWLTNKYGRLDKITWREDLKKGFNECWRVLEDYGVLIFKWSESEISHKEILEVIKYKPLFGHPTARSGKTKWFCFMKIPKNEIETG